MPTSFRRHLLQIAFASFVVLAAPRPVRAQWGAAIKYLIEAVAVIVGGVEVGKTIADWLKDERCKVSITELESLKFECELVANSLDAEGTGAIPRLNSFLESKDEHSWQRAKVALGTLLNNGVGMIAALNQIVGKLNEKTYPGPHQQLNRVRNGIGTIRASVAYLAGLPDKPDPETLTLARSVLKEIASLPVVAREAAKALQVAAEERRKLSC